MIKRILILSLLLLIATAAEAQFNISGRIRSLGPANFTLTVMNIKGDIIVSENLQSGVPFTTKNVDIPTDYYIVTFGNLKKGIILENKPVTVKGLLDGKDNANSDLVVEGAPLSDQLARAVVDFKKSAGGWNWAAVKDKYPLLVLSTIVYEEKQYFSTDHERMAELAGKFTENDRKSLVVQHVESMEQKMRQFSLGAKVGSVELPDRDGKLVRFSDFKGKLILLDFWASWCGPCRKEMQSLKTIYEEIKSDDIVFISISLDDDKSRWLNAIDADNIPWLMLWDSDGFGKSKMKEQFGFVQIPFIVLIGKDGSILARGLRGESVKETIEKYSDTIEH